MKNILMFHNNWITYDYKDLTVNEYPNKNFTPTTLEDALVRQAKSIFNDVKPIVFLSGGIDSQAIALGFILAELEVEYVYIRLSFCNYYDQQDYFFATQFCKKHNINLKIIDLEFDKDSLRDFLLEQDYFNTPTGTGTIFLLEGIRRYKGDGIPILGDGKLVFENINNKCKGIFKKPGLALSYGIKLENQILFDFHYNYIFQYYEHIHRTTPEIQYLSKMEAKNLIYTKLGFPFRPKLSGWEFLDDTGDYSSLSVIDWSNDHSEEARITRGINAIVNKLDLSEKYTTKLINSVIKNKLKKQEIDNNNYITLYEFDTKYYYD